MSEPIRPVGPRLGPDRVLPVGLERVKPEDRERRRREADERRRKQTGPDPKRPPAGGGSLVDIRA